MIDLSHGRQLRFWYVVIWLSVSAIVPILWIQDDEESHRLCFEIGPFQDQIQACLQNRILQLDAEVEINDEQIKRLRVAAKGVLKREARRVEGHFYYGNPLLSKFWKSNLNRVLDEDQLARMVDFDKETHANLQRALSDYNSTPHDPATKANFVATNLRVHLYLSRRQTQKVTELLKTHLDELDAESWDSKLTSFYQSNQEELELVLAESQRLFFDGKSLINGIGDRSVWDAQWRKASCTDCHWG